MDWDKAKKHLERMFEHCRDIGPASLYVAGQIIAYQLLLEAGDRSEQLYDAIMKLK